MSRAEWRRAQLHVALKLNFVCTRNCSARVELLKRVSSQTTPVTKMFHRLWQCSVRLFVREEGLFYQLFKKKTRKKETRYDKPTFQRDRFVKIINKKKIIFPPCEVSVKKNSIKFYLLRQISCEKKCAFVI